MPMKPETELAKVSARIEADKARQDELIMILRGRGESYGYIARYTKMQRSGVVAAIKRLGGSGA